MAELLINDYLDATPGDTVDVVSGVAANLVEVGRGDEAIALVDRARDVLPGDSLLLARAFLLERLDRVPEAVADMRKVAERRPDDPTALNALGYTLVDRTRSVEEGTRLIERAIAAKPDSYAIQDSMGWALVQAGTPRRRQVLARQGLGRIGRPGGRRAPRRDALAHGTHRRGEEAVGWGARRQSRQSPAQARDRAPRAVTLRLAALSLVLLAGGCATLPAPGDDWPARRAALQALDAWALDGRIAVAAGDDGFSGGFDWRQQGERADISLTGPMGGDAMDIQVEGGQAVVSLGGEDLASEDAEALIARYSGRAGPCRSCRCATGSSACRRPACRTRRRSARTAG